MKGLSILIPLLISLALVSVRGNTDYAVNFGFEDTDPYVRVQPFTFGGSSYTIMAHGKFEELKSGARHTLIHAYTENSNSAEDQGQVIVTLVGTSKLELTLGRDNNKQTVTTGHFGIGENTFFSFILTVSDAGNGHVNVVAYFNNRLVFNGQVKGVAAAGVRSAVIGAQLNRISGSYSNLWNGVLDNVAIFNAIVSESARKSHVNTENWSPTNSEMVNLALWLNFDDPLAQLENTAVGIVGIDGPNVQWVEATLHNSASFVPHIVSDSWSKCHATGDPHYYLNGHHIPGGEHTKYGKAYLGCFDVEAEVRTYTRYTIWWGATVFRAVGVRYQDYVWRINQDERHSSPDDTRPGTPYCRLGYSPGTFMKHISQTTWDPIYKGTVNHEETGVRYQVGDNRLTLKVTIPQIMVVEAHRAASGRYINLYVSVNTAVCTDRYGACTYDVNKNARIDFEDWLPPQKLPDIETPPSTPCTGVAENIESLIKERCKNIYPNNEVAYNDCLFDACAAGDPDIIAQGDLTPECLLERIISNGSSSVSCEVNKCRNSCYGRGTCGTEGVCECTTPGYGGNDCYQLDNFKCMEAAYTSVSMNIEPSSILDLTPDRSDLEKRFGDYTVFRSLLINPVTYKGVDYLNFVFSDSGSPTSGSVRVCITENNGVNPGSPQLVPSTAGALSGSLSLSGEWAGNQLCMQVAWPAFVSGGFYIELSGDHDLTISVNEKVNMEQVLIGSANGRGGVDVAKIPETEHGSISFTTSNCDNTVCHQHDGDCQACYNTAGCGYCIESDRCMLGTSQGPRRGTCGNWRYELDEDLSRVVTTIYDGNDLVDPNVEVFLGSLASGSSVPVNIYVPTGRTNTNIDLHFVFGLTGSFAINAGSIKSNLLNAMLNLGDINLGIGFYGSAAAKTSLTMTTVGPNNRYLFGRAMEAPRGLVTGEAGGQFRALRLAAGDLGSGVGFRKFSRKIVVIMAYDTPQNNDHRTAARTAVAQSGILPVWLIPTDVDDSVAEYYQTLADSVDGIPSIVLRTSPSGSNWVDLFNKIISLASSFPHIVIDNADSDEYTHVDTAALTVRSDSLNILGLTNSAFRARFVIPMKKGDDNGHRTATITVPGFGSSTIKDVPSQVPTSEDRRIKGKENQRCIAISLRGSVFNNLYKPVFNIQTVPGRGTLYTPDLVTVVTPGLYAQREFCFVPEKYDYSEPGQVYASFTYSAMDGCQSSSTSTVEIEVAGIFEAPFAKPMEITILETDQDADGFRLPIDFVVLEADRDPSTNEPETVSITYIEVPPVLNDLFESPDAVFKTVGDGQDLVYGTPYEGFVPNPAPSFNFTHQLEYVPSNPNFFGTFQTNARLFDGTLQSTLIPIRVVVQPVNDIPVTDIATEQWTLEDTPGYIQLKADDIDSTGLSFRITVNTLPGDATLETPTGELLVEGNTYEDACIGNPRSRTITCDLLLTPGANENSCTITGRPENLATQCGSPYASITVTAIDNNIEWGGGVGLSESVTVDFHVLAVNDPPEKPTVNDIYLKEDDINTPYDILGSDIDSSANEIDIFVASLPNPASIQLYQIDPSTGEKGDQITTEAELFDWNLKRLATQNHRLIIESTPNIHGNAPDFELGTFEVYADDGELPSDKVLVTVFVKPINDAPVPLVTSFSKNEDDEEPTSSILTLTASDVDNTQDELVFRITQLPFFDDENDLGIKVYTVDNGEKKDLIKDLDIAGDGFIVPKSDNGEAQVWIENLPNWYLRDETNNVLTYTVTDQDNYLNEDDEDYKVHVISQDVPIDIKPVNDRPVISWAQPEGIEDSAIVITLFGEDDAYAEDDTIVAQIMSIRNFYSVFYDTDSKGFYQYSDALVADPTDLTGAVPINPGDVVTDPQFRILYIPPANLNTGVDGQVNPLYVRPSFTYKMTETVSHVPPLQNSPESDSITIYVHPVNDAPVAYGGEWQNDVKLNFFYGIPDEGVWEEPNDLCYDHCQFSENFGSTESFISSLSTELIYFGGRDVEGDDLSVRITSVDCVSGAELFLVSSSGQEPITHEDLVGKQLDIEISQFDGYSLTAGLAFRPAINDWNELNPEETRESGHVYPLGEESDHYCLIEYVVIDSENLASEPKSIEIDIMQMNTQPLEIFQFPEGDLSNDYSQIQATSTIVQVDENREALLYLNATDAEGDDFVASIVKCGTRGSFYLPSANQAEFITNGIIDRSDLSAILDLEHPVDCDDNNNVNVHLGTTFFETGKQGWYIGFFPETNDVGIEYNEIVISYDDNVVDGQLPTRSTRSLTVNTINNAPSIFVENKLIAGENGSLIQPQSLTLVQSEFYSLGLSFGDLEATDEDGSARSPYFFRIEILSIPPPPEESRGTPPPAFTWRKFDPKRIASASTLVPPNFEEDYYGYIQFQTSIGRANILLNGLELSMTRIGEYKIQFTVIDNGFLGSCPTNIVRPDPAELENFETADYRRTVGREGDFINGDHTRCIRESSGIITLNVTQSGTLIATIATAAGAGVLALVALGAVAAAKIAQPKDKDAWQALGTSEMEGAITSGIHESQTITGTSPLYKPDH